jgi:hypothetical protein
MRQAFKAIALSLTLTAVLAGCGTAAAAGRETVTGTFAALSPVAPTSHHMTQPVIPLPGRIVAISATGRRFQVTASGGRFRLSLSPGTYRFLGYSPRVLVNNAQMRCGAAHLIHVTIGRRTPRVDVFCPLA